MGDVVKTISGFFLDSGQGMVLLTQVILVIAPFLMPNTWVRKIGEKVGRLLSLFLRQKVGIVPGERVEAYFQGTVSAFTDGLFAGMDEDDENGGRLQAQGGPQNP